MDTINQQILDAIPSGKYNAKKVSQITEEVEGIEDQDPTCYKVRKRIKNMIESREEPIGWCYHGYFIIETRQELVEYQESLEGRIAGIEDRIAAVGEAFEGK